MSSAYTAKEFAVGSSTDVSEGGRLVVDAGEKTIGVFRVEGRLYAYENTCPHQSGPVCQGLVIPAVNEVLNDQRATTGFVFDAGDLRIVCPWHGFEFSIKTGCHPLSARIKLIPVNVEEHDGTIYVSL
ncbi:MAG TPA: Rieske 2Fe-2S domain-containing protein [Bryobacteraceae bacterium]|nr:Rieske 2Fe-2S domain-containing protein [Bryobacteraceae bacterium]